MRQSNSERTAEIMKIVNEIASSVTDASRKADPETGAKLRSAARTLVEHADKNSHDIEELYDYLRTQRITDSEKPLIMKQLDSAQKLSPNVGKK